MEARETRPPPRTAHLLQFILKLEYGKQDYWHQENRDLIFAISTGEQKIASSHR